jgi:hypothetical protein
MEEDSLWDLDLSPLHFFIFPQIADAFPFVEMNSGEEQA